MITLAEHILRRAARTPEAPAVEGAVRWSYGELAERVRRLAEELRELTPEGSLVASEAVSAHAGAVALLAAGSVRRALLPVETTYPEEYREGVLRDARVAAVLRESPDGELTVAVHGLPGARLGMQGIAYTLYTSGSTGRPKGVVVSHEALLARMTALPLAPGLAPGESMLALSALSFDVSVTELLLPLYVGGRIVSAPPGARRDQELFQDFVEDCRPDVLQATPSYWRLALACGWKGAPDARLWTVGEALTESLAADLLPRCAELWNAYGPTETTIYATAALVRSADEIRLGDPLPGTGLLLAEPEGEIVLYGTGLAEGYLDRDELTAERFPVLDTPDGPRRCYRTGDRGRLHPDGGLEFLGRLDDQVKVHGNRVELGHVESVFESCEGVREAVALLLESTEPEQPRLGVVVVVEPDVTRRRLREHALRLLPRPMIPEQIIVTHEPLPRTPAGKADRVALRGRYAPGNER